MADLNTIKEMFGLDVTCTAGDDPCLHIENSYMVEDKSTIKLILTYIHDTDEYKALVEAGYNRTYDGEYKEWAAHNVLYRWGINRSSTRSVDINNKETKFRKFCYAFLSTF
jgi:hypothetical protein